MKYTQIGSLKVSKVCLGCMGFGDASQGMHSWTLPYEDSKKIIFHALESGINFFDTAMAYQSGTSEEYLGCAIKEYGHREDVIIATKYTPKSDDSIDSRTYLTECLNNSLRRLQTDYIDLYIMHMWDYQTPIEETLEILNDFIKEGKIKEIGISNCFAYQLAMANTIAKERGLQGFVSVQGHYNLIFREEEREMKRYCDEQGIAMTPYSALASGRLAKHPGETSQRLEKDTYAKGKYDASSDLDLKIIQRVEELASKHHVSMSEVSLSWLMSKVASPVVGATKLKHVDTAVLATELELSEEEKQYLEEPYQPHPLVGVMATNTK